METLRLFLAELDQRQPTLRARALDEEVKLVGFSPKWVPGLARPVTMNLAHSVCTLERGECAWPLKQISGHFLIPMAINLARRVLKSCPLACATLLTWPGWLPEGQVDSAHRVHGYLRPSDVFIGGPQRAVHLRFLTYYDLVNNQFVLRADVFYGFANPDLTAHEQELVTLLMEARNEYAALLARQQYAAVA